ncbi:MAG: DUF2442 domain-containing protein [Anaerolineae bacterium]
MSLKEPGASTLVSEVTNIASTGFWLLADNVEYFVPFSDYPAFLKAPVEQIFAVKQIGPRQLYWPELDTDIELDALENPERYPLVWRE